MWRAFVNLAPLLAWALLYVTTPTYAGDHGEAPVKDHTVSDAEEEWRDAGWGVQWRRAPEIPDVCVVFVKPGGFAFPKDGYLPNIFEYHVTDTEDHCASGHECPYAPGDTSRADLDPIELPIKKNYTDAAVYVPHYAACVPRTNETLTNPAWHGATLFTAAYNSFDFAGVHFIAEGREHFDSLHPKGGIQYIQYGVHPADGPAAANADLIFRAARAWQRYQRSAGGIRNTNCLSFPQWRSAKWIDPEQINYPEPLGLVEYRGQDTTRQEPIPFSYRAR